jgi:hypothetical protein
VSALARVAGMGGCPVAYDVFCAGRVPNARPPRLPRTDREVPAVNGLFFSSFEERL